MIIGMYVCVGEDCSRIKLIYSKNYDPSLLVPICLFVSYGMHLIMWLFAM